MDLHENYDRAMHTAGVSLKDCRLSVQTAVLNWDLQHSNDPERMLHDIRRQHVEETARHIVKRMTEQHFDKSESGERIIRTHCLVMSMSDFEKVVNAEVEYRMSRLSPPLTVRLSP